MEDYGCLPDSWSYNIMIQGLLRNNDSTSAIQLLNEMVRKGFSADLSTADMLVNLASNDETVSRFLLS
uniref:Pentatricopeptide repeat-containing protein n=1 Tax=Rhizophora mucronata TaxID=61149 RepID=A0A2P2KD19_RHIMU